MTYISVGAIGSDPDALEAFYRLHIEDIQRFVARRVAAPQDAADLTAEVFLAAIDSCGRYRPEAAPPIAWLFGIARNVIAMHYRSAGRAARAATRIDTSGWIDSDAAERIAARIDAESAGRAAVAAMNGLPERQRALVELVAVDGLSLTDAAGVLGISPTNARVGYHRARRKLGSLLGDDAGETEEGGRAIAGVWPPPRGEASEIEASLVPVLAQPVPHPVSPEEIR